MQNKKTSKRESRLPGAEKEQLKDSLRDLIADAERYDYGDFRAIKRSAATLRLLFYDTERQTSLISNLNDKDRIIMQSFNTKVKHDRSMSYGSVYVACFKTNKPDEFYNTFLFMPDSKRTTTFEKWWNESLFFMKDSSHDTRLTRSKIITTIANQDGGAHFDKRIDSLYKNLMNGNTGVSIEPGLGADYLLGYDSSVINHSVHFKDLALAYMREIVHESILSLQNYYGLNSILYKPNFNFNWSRKTNYMAWQFGLERE
ncbi:hypothetical protein NE287_06225 [Pediococcus pentosaceus]|uniref:hypothetical protein n=1 Tax=Pediococcus pentosaceus TaxID=1255 RepID=UPI00207399C6|nr:hypothetical protein [Pediococcus pentosaceus]MCM6810363.1 hypothetical protein [Pediococcus pentosaceus]